MSEPQAFCEDCMRIHGYICPKAQGAEIVALRAENAALRGLQHPSLGCDTPGCIGDPNYSPPGRGHNETCLAYKALGRTTADIIGQQRDALKALITDGHNLEVRLRDLATYVELLWPDEDMPDEVADTIGAGKTALYEWDKRARRAGVDWWNRK